MEKFIKRISAVEAVQWDESKKTLKAMGVKAATFSSQISQPDLCEDLNIEEAASRKKNVNPGDWIVKTDYGEIRVYDPDSFVEVFKPEAKDHDFCVGDGCGKVYLRGDTDNTMCDACLEKSLAKIAKDDNYSLGG